MLNDYNTQFYSHSWVTIHSDPPLDWFCLGGHLDRCMTQSWTSFSSDNPRANRHRVRRSQWVRITKAQRPLPDIQPFILQQLNREPNRERERDGNPWCDISFESISHSTNVAAKVYPLLCKLSGNVIITQQFTLN